MSHLIVQNRARINCVNISKLTPLMIASSYNHLFIMEYLLKMGAKIDARDNQSNTALLLAASEGHVEAVQVTALQLEFVTDLD